MKTRFLILFPHEVRAALAGTLGLVVRPVNGLPHQRFTRARTNGIYLGLTIPPGKWLFDYNESEEIRIKKCPFGVPGDRLCCKETWGHTGQVWKAKDAASATDGQVVYQVSHDVDGPDFRWWSPATMPAWASRITLDVVGVRVMRAQELTEEDAKAAGIVNVDERKWVTNVLHFKRLWDSHYAKRGLGWDANPWAWAVAVRRP
ncbi:hypothetical protein DFW101_3572 [Solidesulfovibrio carbinoliphilus subsp. oakridgensis]|uniref:Uncharacterized protein n=1 Tax=Solidesulfovibrio carbinoliphilus subsp. oakridgensis TaxID=694327 RepID=G7Q5K9_9BACT|nr:hypothetical protein [Solidesulfovibrio carbinoliphilus]EHJ49568.1 hypothetical protein DFW101_3572 [Solidesulfovibrio carbinoliphilus subsp. oakridgensis]